MYTFIWLKSNFVDRLYYDLVRFIDDPIDWSGLLLADAGRMDRGTVHGLRRSLFLLSRLQSPWKQRVGQTYIFWFAAVCYTGWPKKLAHFLYALTSSNIDRFSNLFHYHSQENICNKTATLHNAIPQVWRYTTLWNVSVLKATIENKMNSVTTHFKSASSSSKADTLNIWCKNCRIRQLL